MRARYCAQHLLGEQPAGVIISDGYGVYRWLPPEQHQLCWAHVIRGLREIAERSGDAGRLGRRLLVAPPRRAVSQPHPERGRDLPHARLERQTVVQRIAAAVFAREPYPDVFGIGLVPSSQSG